MRRCLSPGFLSLLLLTGLPVTGANDALAADEPVGGAVTEDAEAQDANMQSWQETWGDDERDKGWTWFGMGYESRRGGANSHGDAGSGGSGGPGKGPGGNGAGGNGGGGGRGKR